MTIQEVFEELRRLYPDRHVEASYLVNNFKHLNEQNTKCEVYLEGGRVCFGRASTWRAALDILIKGNVHTALDIEPCDDGEGGKP